MAMNDCVDSISKALGRPPTDAELERIAADVQARLKAKIADGMAPRDAAREVNRDVSEENALRKAQARFVAFKNIQVYADLQMRKMEGRGEIATEKSLLSGISTWGTRNAASSVDALHHVLRDNLLYPMVRQLQKAGILKLALSGDRDFNKRVAIELKRRADPSLEQPTGDARAVKAAEIYGKVLDTSRAMLNKEGAFIGKIDGYMGRQYHDMWKVRGDGSDAAFQKWRTAIMADRDVERDFKGMDAEQMTSQLRSEWKALSTGVFDAAGNKTGGEYSVANKVSQQRSINFRTAEGWFNYNEAFGKGTVLDAIQAGADHAARDTALMRTFGPTPKAMFDKFHTDLMRDAESRGDLKMHDRLKGDPNKSLFEMVSGIREQPGNLILAKRAAEVRSLMQIIHLGQIMASAVTHIGLNAALLRHNGVPFLEGMANQLRSLFPQTAAGKEMAGVVHAGLDGMFGHVIRRFHTEDGPAGSLAGAVNIFHKLNGFSYFMDAQKQGVGLALSHSLGRNAGKEFEQLDGKMQTSLRRYGIEKAEWDQIRQTPQKAADGRTYLVPEHVADPKLADKLQTYITDQVREGANEPTPWARNMAAMKTQSGTLSGEIWRTLTQFKSFAITMAERQWGRELRRNGLDVPGVLLLASSMTAFGFLGNQLRGLIANQQMTMPTDAKGWGQVAMDSMVNGGAIGLFADGFLRSGMKSGGDLLKSLLGPTATVGVDAAVAINHLFTGAPAGSSARTTRASTGLNDLHTVGNDLAPNWWFARGAYNYLIPYSVANMIHPGAVQRHEKVMRENNQTWILPPH